MHKPLYLATAMVLVLLMSQNASAQKNPNKITLLADEMVYNEDFSTAINMYNSVIQKKSKDYTLRFKLGYCYLNTANKRDSSTICFLKADSLMNKRQRKKAPGIENQFYLGRSYRVTENFDTALGTLSPLKNKAKKNEDFQIAVDNEIKLCKMADSMAANPIAVKITTMGEAINTEYTEHSPILTIDESEMLFTSRRPLKEGEQPMSDGQYKENIYRSISGYQGVWTQAEPISDSINAKDNVATGAINYDASEIIIYKDEDEGSLFSTTFDGKNWGTPKKLNNNINTQYRETGACMSLDGNKLYFVSDRPGGYGGYDVYVSQRESNGDWGEAVNMGSTINTSKDEEGPYIMPDYSRIYFSSKGHEGVGGYDIFYADSDHNGGWTEPQNIGWPINTFENDVFMYIVPSGERLYFASDRPDSKGKADIYQMELPESMHTDRSVVVAYVKVCQPYRIDLPQSKIEITDNETNLVASAIPNSTTGKFVFVCKKGNEYNIKATVDNQTVYDEKYKCPENAAGKYELEKRIQLDPQYVCPEDQQEDLIASKDTSAIEFVCEIEDINFGFAKAQLNENTKLDSLVKYLKNYPEAVVKVIGYADSKGKALYNINLTKQRAQAVYNELVNKGVKNNQIKIAGYGEENPISYNITNNQYNEESMKYNRRIEFRMEKQGAKKIVIKPIRNIPAEYQNPDYNKDYVKKQNVNPETTK